MSLLTDEVRAHVGRTVTYTAPEELGRASMRYFARAVGDDDPRVTDVEAARAAGFRDVMAPPTFVCETNQYLDRRPDDEGYIGHGWGIEIPGTRLLRGGHEYAFHEPVHPDVVLTVTWEVADIEARTSSNGSELVIVSSLATYRDQHGTLLATNRETLIYQELPRAE